MKLRLITAITIGALYVQAHASEVTQQTTTPAVQAPATSSTAKMASNSTTTSTKTAAPSSVHPTPHSTGATAVKPAATTANAAIPKITVDKSKVSYSIGVDLGENFKAQGIEVDPAMLARGLKDATTGTKPLYTQQEMATTLIDFQKQLIAKRQAELTAMASKNLQESNTFLNANKTKPGIVTTASGLQYKVITPGSGNPPSDKSTVTVDYVGQLPDGKVFDSSYQRGKPVTFPVAEVIPGWSEALKLMKPGATYEIYVPANLAYGERGLGPVIGPNQALVFKIHLISVNVNNEANATKG